MSLPVLKIKQHSPKNCQCNVCKNNRDAKEADSSSAQVSQLRPRGVEKKHKAVSKINKYEERSVKIGIKNRFKENDSLEPVASNAVNKFSVILIQEGLGNLNDCFYYTKDCLKNSYHLFEGVKCFADHADQIEEQVHPERSTKDILGHFESVQYTEVDGRGQIRGTLVLCGGTHFDWAKSLLTNSIEYAHKYPTGDFVGLSINASGEAGQAPISELLNGEPISDDIKQKLNQAMAEGISEVRPVSILKDAVSCDLVTEAGAGGKILAMMERNKKPMKAKKKDDKKVKEAKYHEESDKHEEAHHEDEKKEAGHEEADGDDADGDDGDEDHADADQDKELFQKMIAQYLGDDSDDVDQEEAMTMGKGAHEHFMKQGMSHEEAYEAAGKHLQAAMAIGKSMHEKSKEAKTESECEGDDMSHDDATPPPAPPGPTGGKKGAAKMPKESNVMRELIKANAEIAKLKESVQRSEVREYLDRKIAALSQKRSPEFIGKFKEALGTPKSPHHVDTVLDVFSKAYDAANEESSETETMFTEKSKGFRESSQSRDNVIDFADCAS